jgi:hypothetical protein
MLVAELRTKFRKAFVKRAFDGAIAAGQEADRPVGAEDQTILAEALRRASFASKHDAGDDKTEDSQLRALRRLQREQQPKSRFVFVGERGAPFSKRGFQAMLERAGEAAGFDMKIQCSGTPVGSSWPTTASIPEPSKPISGISRSSVRCAIPNWRLRGSRACFGTETEMGLRQFGQARCRGASGCSIFCYPLPPWGPVTHISCKIWYSISQTVSDLGNIHDRSIRAFAVKPRAFGAPLRGFGA